MVVLIMGVAGSGKSTVGKLLADKLGWAYVDADDLHPPANVAKMASGVALTDADRRPWLAVIGAWMNERQASQQPAIVTCSALKRSYRDSLREYRPDLRLVYLRGDRDLISSRLAARHRHFFPRGLLNSQFAELEEPGADEDALVIGIEENLATSVNQIIKRLDLKRLPE